MTTTRELRMLSGQTAARPRGLARRRSPSADLFMWLCDVGGLLGPAGFRIRAGRVLVGAEGLDLTPKDRPALAHGGVRTLLELAAPTAPAVEIRPIPARRPPVTCLVAWTDASEAGQTSGPMRILECHGMQIATALSHLASPGGQPVVMYGGGPGGGSGYVAVVLWEMLGVPRELVRARLAGPAKEWLVGPGLDGPPKARSGTGAATWQGRLDPGDVADLLGDIDARGGIDVWWVSTGEPAWVPEVLRATLLERV